MRCAGPHASLAATISSNTSSYRPPRNGDRFITMSISSAPVRDRVAGSPASRASSGPRPDGNAPATLATCDAGARELLDRDRHQLRVHAHRGDGRHLGSSGSGRSALAHSATTLPGVSVPSRVVRSMHRIARSSPQTFASRLIDRVASAAARPPGRRRRPRSPSPRCGRPPARWRRVRRACAARARLPVTRPPS